MGHNTVQHQNLTIVYNRRCIASLASLKPMIQLKVVNLEIDTFIIINFM
jgi:hypothetical protein